MPRKAIARKPTSILPSPDELAESYLDIEHWPQRWCVEPRDLPPGLRLLIALKPFLLHLLATGLTPKTLHRHRDHLEILGGQIIWLLHDQPQLRKRPIERVLRDSLEEDGGPLIYPRISETQQRSFDSTCRKLYRFLFDSDSTPE